ncbi:MAG TPA: AcvB/VirJ family lysyl-phosphatidylglycerol hydrolase [Gemmatimonadaceae bacterium]|jgi:type IV secretory pathway VirJ component|nr:AcvB/VirJ family lysyl-phosphatidylglycerol hydrolase [Gemmatimonadaceae bacterium]
MNGIIDVWRSRGLAVAISLVVATLASPLAAAHAATPAARALQATSGTDSLSALPLEVVRPASGDSAAELAVLLTGDGGWADIDKAIADSLARHGIPVVALNSREYLATKRTPQEVANDVARIIRYYAPAFGKRDLLLVGYSRGADLMPFVANRLPSDLRSRVRLVALLGLAPNANFKFHLVDLVSNHHRSDDLPTLPEVQRLRGTRILCFYGAKEKEAACSSLPDSVATAVEMPDGHHFGGRYGEIADRIMAALQESAVTTSRP